MKSKPARKDRRKLMRGAVMVEYAFLLFTVAVPAAGGIYAGGLQMARDYGSLRDAILKPTP